MGENKFYRIIEWIFSVILLGVLLVLLVLDNRWYYVYQNKCVVPNFVFLLSFIAVAALIYHLCNVYKKKHADKPQPAPTNLKRTMKVIGVLTVVLFVVQIIYAWEIYFETGWDCREIVTAAQGLCYEGTAIADSHYFSIYPNNVFLTGIFAGILKAVYMCGINANYFPLIIVGCLLVSLSGYFFADCVRMLTVRKGLIYIFWIVFVLMTGLSPWVSIPYSDTYSIFFPIFCVWLFLLKDDDNYLTCWFFITFTALVGYFIKPTVFLTLIVLLFFEVVNFLCNVKSNSKKMKWKRSVGLIATVFLAAFMAFFMRYGMEKVTGFTPDENKHFTAIHYLRMGMNEEYGGGYNQTDVNASASYATVSERNAGDFKEAMSRIKGMLPFRFVKFMAQKCLTNFNDGTYAWGNEGAFYWAYYDRENGLADFLRSYVYHIGEKHDTYVVFCQWIWFWNLCFACFILRKGRTQKDYRETAIITCMLAIMCFLMVFEARARYLYLYGPIIYLCGAMGMNRLLMGKREKED